MLQTRRRFGALVLIAALAAIGSGCGETEEAVERTSEVSGATRIERCVEQYPDSTKAECEDWEDEETLGDDGTHREHED